MFHRTALLGQPGSRKSTCGLSYPGVEQHVFGSSEEDTALNFSDRKDILPCVKPDWFNCLTDEEKKKFTDDNTSEIEIGMLTRKARAKSIAKYRRYLYSLKADIPAGKRPELKTVFLDNGTPFSQDFQDYVRVVYENDFITKEGNFNSISFGIKYQTELTDFFRLFYSIPCHTVAAFHVSMNVDEETAAKVNFMDDMKKGIIRPKEWTPMIMGKTKYILAGIPTWAFFLWSEDEPGKPTKYYAKLEPDSVSKGRIQPFEKPGKIEFDGHKFFDFLNGAVEKKTGVSK